MGHLVDEYDRLDQVVGPPSTIEHRPERSGHRQPVRDVQMLGRQPLSYESDAVAASAADTAAQMHGHG